MLRYHFSKTKLRLFYTSGLFIIVFLATAGTLSSQTVSDPDLKGLAELWNKGQTDSLKRVLPLYQKKYGRSPEFLFLNAALNSDASEAVKVYESLLQQHPKNIFADQCLLRLIQYNVSLGLYQAAENYLKTLKSQFPDSPALATAVQLFPGDDSGDSGTSGAQTKDTVASGVYALQVGAFSEKQNAEKLIKTLREKGFTDITAGEKTVNDKKLFTVIIGSYANRDQAAAAGQTLKKNHGMNYSIVTR